MADEPWALINERQTKWWMIGHRPPARLPITITTKPSDENPNHFSFILTFQHMLVHNQVSSIYDLLSVYWTHYREMNINFSRCITWTHHPSYSFFLCFIPFSLIFIIRPFILPIIQEHCSHQDSQDEEIPNQVEQLQQKDRDEDLPLHPPIDPSIIPWIKCRSVRERDEVKLGPNGV